MITCLLELLHYAVSGRHSVRQLGGKKKKAARRRNTDNTLQKSVRNV